MALFAVAAAQTAQAACVTKAADGTGSDRASATFQAYEAVLHATDQGMASAWMSSSHKIGVAPGYSVSNVRSSCKAEAHGQTRHVQATLCK